MKNELKNSLESLNTLNKNLKKSTTEGNWNEILEEINYHKSKLENINNKTTSFSLSANSSAALMGIENLTKKVVSAQKKEVVNLFEEINSFKNIVSEISNNESTHLNGNWKGFIEEINNYKSKLENIKNNSANPSLDKNCDLALMLIEKLKTNAVQEQTKELNALAKNLKNFNSLIPNGIKNHNIPSSRYDSFDKLEKRAESIELIAGDNTLNKLKQDIDSLIDDGYKLLYPQSDNHFINSQNNNVEAQNIRYPEVGDNTIFTLHTMPDSMLKEYENLSNPAESDIIPTSSDERVQEPLMQFPEYVIREDNTENIDTAMPQKQIRHINDHFTVTLDPTSKMSGNERSAPSHKKIDTKLDKDLSAVEAEQAGKSKYKGIKNYFNHLKSTTSFEDLKKKSIDLKREVTRSKYKKY